MAKRRRGGRETAQTLGGASAGTTPGATSGSGTAAGAARRRAPLGDAGQATVEHVGLVLLLAALLAAVLAAAGTLAPGTGVARAIGERMLCAVGARDCGTAAPLAVSPLERAYGGEVAALVASHAPALTFEDDRFVSLPVDFRACRRRACADSIERGILHRTQTGLTPVAFTHVVDCRDPERAAAEGYECGGVRAGRVYIQYWLYYPDSATRPLGKAGYHLDDWESLQCRVEAAGRTRCRASSHHGYNGRETGIAGLASDAGAIPRPGWDEDRGVLHVAAGSHAGMTAMRPGDSRWLAPEDLRLIPLEELVAAGGLPDFAVSPPWRKTVWRDPESMRT